MKILLICGHGANDPGACSSYGVERDETRRVGNKLQQLLKPYMEVVMYPQSHNAYADVYNGTFAVSLSGIDYVIEVHFNSASEAAKGTEVWVTPIEGSTAVEQKIVNNLASCGFVNRGIKSEYFAVINYCKNRGVSSALVETCFISNKDDMQTYKSKFNQVCEAMAKGIVEGFGISYKSTTTVEVKEEEVDYKGENDMFNEEWYLFRYKDVASAVKKGSFKSGYDHYKILGKKEKRQPIPPLPTNFVESEYRELNKDVDDAIKNGTFTSGAEHWLKYGWRPTEKRKVCKNESDEQAKKRVKELEKQVKELEDKISKAKKELN